MIVCIGISDELVKKGLDARKLIKLVGKGGGRPDLVQGVLTIDWDKANEIIRQEIEKFGKA